MFPVIEKVVVVNFTIVDVATPGNAWASDPVPTTFDSFNILFTQAKETAFCLTSNTCALASLLGMRKNIILITTTCKLLTLRLHYFA